MKKRLSHKEFSRRGGLSTKNKLGKKHYQEIGTKGAETVRRKYGPDYYKKLSEAGVAARIKKRMEQEGAIITEL